MPALLCLLSSALSSRLGACRLAAIRGSNEERNGPRQHQGQVPRPSPTRPTEHIRRDIISGALPPGTKLAMEMLTKRYDVGLSLLREALVKLTGDALAVAEGQRGFWVSQISLDELQDTMSTRLLIETQALSLAIDKGGPEWSAPFIQAYEGLCALEASSRRKATWRRLRAGRVPTGAFTRRWCRPAARSG